MEPLLPHQRTALQHVRSVAIKNAADARNDLRVLLKRAAISESTYTSGMSNFQERAQIAIHFHPERLSRDGRTVAEGLLQYGVYKTQFETGISSGSLSPGQDGERSAWEERLFGGAYQAVEATPATRPRYGALDVVYHPDGPAPRFGSCYFLLRREVSSRSSFTFGGSHEDHAPERSGTLEVLEPVLAPLLQQLESGSGAFGLQDLTIHGLLDHMQHPGREKPASAERQALGRSLDSFIEAHVHGGVRLSNDVQTLVVDEAFRDHPVMETLSSISRRYSIRMEWYAGFQLPVGRVPVAFRGFEVRRLAERIAGDGVLDAARIGDAANSVVTDPEAWSGWDTDALRVQFRRLWHVVVLNGAL